MEIYPIPMTGLGARTRTPDIMPPTRAPRSDNEEIN